MLILFMVCEQRPLILCLYLLMCICIQMFYFPCSTESEVSFKDHVLLDTLIKDFPSKG